jgi:hypothetical protein
VIINKLSGNPYFIRKLTILAFSFEYGGYRTGISRRFDFDRTDRKLEKVSNELFP